MTAPARARAQLLPPGHIHLPSVHIRRRGGSGYDYDEDIYVRGRGRKMRAERVIQLAVIEDDTEQFVRHTTEELCADEIEALLNDLPILMDEENPATLPMMKESAAREYARQMRITNGKERACSRCGCSETRACSGGCVWATSALCSRCV